MKTSLLALFLSFLVFNSSLYSINTSKLFKHKLRKEEDDSETKEKTTDEFLTDLISEEEQEEKETPSTRKGANKISSETVEQKIKSKCSKLEKENCLNSGACGWCLNSAVCIPGNKNGPLSPCNKKDFYYDKKNPEKEMWNSANASSVNVYVGDRFVLTKTPDLNKIHVDPNQGFRR